MSKKLNVFNEKESENQKKWYLLVIVLNILLMSIGYAAFTSNMDIELGGNFIVVKDIRLTNVNYDSSENNGKDNNSPSFSSNGFNIDINLPQADSKIIYKLEITNYGNVEQGISKIYNFPDNLQVKTINYDIGSKICNGKSCTRIHKDILIEISYSDNGFDGVNTEFKLNVLMNFQPFYKVTYSKFQDVIGFTREVIGGSTYELNYSVREGQYIAVYMNNVLLDSDRYTYENNKLKVENVEGNLKIELRNLDCLKEREKIGTVQYGGITVTSHGDGVYSINGSTDEDIFIRLSDYLFATSNKLELMSEEMPNNKVVLKKDYFYDITFNRIEGSHNVSSNNKARFVFRKPNSTDAYQLFGYDFFSGPFGTSEFPLEDDLGMFSLFIAGDSVFDNYKFKISVTEVYDVDVEDYGPITDKLSKNNFIINFYDQTNTIEFVGTNNTELFIDLTNRQIYITRPDTSNVTEPLFKAGDRIRVSYEFVKNYPTSTKEISFPLRTIGVSSVAIDDIKITSKSYDLSNNITKEYTLDQDASILSIYASGNMVFNHYRFRINVEKIS